MQLTVDSAVYKSKVNIKFNLLKIYEIALLVVLFSFVLCKTNVQELWKLWNDFYQVQRHVTNFNNFRFNYKLLHEPLFKFH